LEFSDIQKELVLLDIKTKDSEIKEEGIKVCFAKHTLSPKQIELAGLEARSDYRLKPVTSRFFISRRA